MKDFKGNNFPRRNILIFQTPAEKSIQDAINAVETCGADIKLTEAVNLLSKAKDLVSDYIDENISK